MRKYNYLNLFYDTGADVLYFSKGISKASDISNEAADEVVIRKNPKSGEVTGFTIMNFSQKTKKVKSSFKLPLEVDLRQISFA